MSAFRSVQLKPESGDELGETASVLQEGDPESLAVKFNVEPEIEFEITTLPEAEFSTPEFVWHEDGETYFVCEKGEWNLEVEQIDTEEWLYRISKNFDRKKQGKSKSKMQAVGHCEGYCLAMLDV